MGSSSNNDGDVNETGKKESVYISKTITLLHLHYTFFLFLSRRCKSATWNFLISRSLSMDLMNTAQEIFFFSKLRYGPFGFNPRQFRQDFKN